MATFRPKAGKVTVGTTAVAVLSITGAVRKLGCTIQADDTNSGDIFVGGSEVDITGSYQGVRLDSGESISLNDLFIGIGVNEWDLTQVYLISDTAAQAAIVIYPELYKA